MEKLLPKISKLMIGTIKIYQFFISPILGSNCRFQITCSQYGIESIIKFGVLKGSWLIINRLIKCHPLHTEINNTSLKENFNFRED